MIKKSKGISKITHVSFSEKKGGSVGSPEIVEEVDSDKSTLDNQKSKEVNNKQVSSINHMSLPSFLQNFGSSSSADKEKKVKNVAEKSSDKESDVKKKSDDKDLGFSFGSISSVFNRDSMAVSGVKRVLRKSLSTLIVTSLLFGLIAIFSTTLFSTNPLFILLVSLLYVAVTAVFYVTVADRSYVWIGLLVQSLLILIVNSFLGQAFSLMTILGTLLIVVFNYFAYTEVEKLQLSSRLFSIGNVTKEAVRILGVSVVLVISLGMFNTVLNKGSIPFLKDTVFTNSFVQKTVVVGEDTLLSKAVHQLTNNSYDNFVSAYRDATFFDFLSFNYSRANGGVIFTNYTEQQQVEKIQTWVNEEFSTIPYDLNTQLDEEKYAIVAEHYYINQLESFVDTQSSSSFEIIPRTYMIPAFFAFVLFVVLMVLKIFFGILLNWFVIPLLWLLLKYTGFVRIDVEHVEAEVVSI